MSINELADLVTAIGGVRIERRLSVPMPNGRWEFGPPKARRRHGSRWVRPPDSIS